MVSTTSDTAPKLRKYACSWVLDGFIVVTMGTADSQVLVGARPIEPSQRYEVVCVPRAVNRMKTVITESSLLSELISPPAFESLRELFALKGITLSFQR